MTNVQKPPAFDLSAYSPQAYKARETHGAVEMRISGQDEHRVLLFVPAQPRLQGDAPIIFFHHGWQGMNPMNFGGLIDRLVRSGHVVIFPIYQNGERTDPRTITDHAGKANRMALNLLAKEFGLAPMQGRTLYYGFSIGSAISINLALNAQHYGLPPANALMLVSPGDAYHVNQGRVSESIYGAIENLPASLPVVIMTGEEDEIGLPTARKIAARLCHIPRVRRIMYVLPSSRYGNSKVMAGHGSPGAPDNRYNFKPSQQQFPQVLQGRNSYEASASLNQLDFLGYWKVMDGLLDGLKTQSFSAHVFGAGTAEQLTLGTWADGTRLNPMRIEEFCK